MLRICITSLIFQYLLMDFKPHSFSPTEIKGIDNQTMDEEQQLSELRHLTELSVNRNSKNTKEPPKQSNESIGLKRKKSVFKHRDNEFEKLTSRQHKRSSYIKFSGVQYSPEDLAQYILRTGDEKGVTLAIEDLLKEKMMNREEAITFLQGVKKAMAEMKPNFKSAINQDDLRQIPKRNEDDIIKVVNNEGQQTPEDLVLNTKTPPASPPETALTTPSSQIDTNSNLVQNEDLEIRRNIPKELLKRKNLHKQDTLQKVVYQLAKEMFKHSLAIDDQTAEESLSRLISFLEGEVKNRRISPVLKESILEIVSSALIDSLKEETGVFSQGEMIYGDKPQKENVLHLQKDPSVKSTSDSKSFQTA